MSVVRRLVVFGLLLGVVAIVCVFAKVPGQVGKVASLARVNVEQMLGKAPVRSSSSTFDVVTSASVMIDQSSSANSDVGS
jgi:hypothetical protein